MLTAKMETKRVSVERAEEVSDMVNHVPPAIIRYGSIVIGLFILLLLLIAWFLRYPELVKTTVSIKSKNFSVLLKSKRQGVISQVFMKDGQSVTKGSHLALFEATANYEEIMSLRRDLSKIRPDILSHRFGNIKIGRYENLGELQIAFQSFSLSYQRSYSFFSKGYYQQKKIRIIQELSDLDHLMGKNKEMLDIQSRLVEIAKTDLARQHELYEKKAISKLELSASERTYLSNYPQLKQAEETTINLDLSIKQKEKELPELEKEANELNTELEHALNTLQSHLKEWLFNYVVVAPISGVVTYAQPVLKDEQFAPNSDLFHIIPNGVQPGFLGISKMSQINLGSVLPGQIVGIKINSYPFERYGIISGRVLEVGRISNTDSTFVLTIDIPNNITDTGCRLHLKDGMSGYASIETLDQSLLESFIFKAKVTMAQ